MFKEKSVRSFGIIGLVSIENSAKFLGTCVIPFLFVRTFDEVSVLEEVTGKGIENCIGTKKQVHSWVRGSFNFLVDSIVDGRW